MRVTGVVRGSPGHTAGLRENDLVLEINDTIGGDEPDAGARLLWAFRRMNPGDLVSVTRQISRRQSHGVHEAHGKERLGVWDGLLLFSVAGGLG